MKKTLLLTALFIVLGAGAWYALHVSKSKQQGSAVSPEMDFAVTNTDEIGKIFMADRKGQTVTLERKDGYWMYNNKFQARSTAMQSLLETIREVKTMYIPTKAAQEGMIKTLATDGIKVEIYDRNNNVIKAYYVGGVTNDERGTVMIMEGSENPYVVHVPTFIGQIRVRYFMGDDNWRDRTVFAETPESIQSISVDYPQQKSNSFRLEKVGTAQYEVKPYYSTTPASRLPQRKGVAEAYLLQFERLVAEGYENTNPLRDSVIALVPFATVSMKKTDGQEKTVRFWPVDVEQDRTTGKTFVVRYFADLNNGEAFLLTQDHVFGPIFRGYPFFFEYASTDKLRN